MSVQGLERAIVAEARLVLKNPKVRLKDLMEWRTVEVKPHDGEVAIRLPNSGVWAAFPASCDKRGGEA